MLGWFRRKARQVARRIPVLRAGYDAADLRHHNLWPTANGLSADATADPAVRRSLRERARAQVENDSLAEGIVDTLAIDLVGIGPRLKMLLEDDDANDVVEDTFSDWWRSANMSDKLYLMVRARIVDGEAFAVLTNNPAIDHPITLDVKVIECDRVTSPDPLSFEDSIIDGIIFDDAGNPQTYSILKQHPGDVMQRGVGYEADEIPADNVLHYFRAKRPEQHRGVSELAPALIKFAHLSRMSLAVLVCTEFQAKHAGMLTTDHIPDADPNNEEVGFQQLQPNTVMDVRPGSVAAAPVGYKLEGFHPTQPTSTYAEYRRAVISEIARSHSMPVGRAMGDYSQHSYASGKLDQLPYHEYVKCERERLARRILERIFRAWIEEAVLVSDLFPVKVRTMLASGDVPHRWNFPGTVQLHGADPMKEAQAATERINNGTSNRAMEAEAAGEDWQEIREQVYVEKAFETKMEKKYGISLTPEPEEEEEAANE